MDRLRGNVDCLLIISAVDPSGGAGAIADVRVARALNFYPCLAVTALTYQNTCRISGIYMLPEDVVRSQVKSILEDVEISCVKIGACAGGYLLDLDVEPVVYDPVLKATVGYELTSLEDCLKVAEISTVITPNESEARSMCEALSLRCTDVEDMTLKLAEELGCSVVVTGKVDFVCDGRRVVKIEGEHTGLDLHGTGCVYSTALACYLVKNDLFRAAKLAKDFVSRAARNPVYVGNCRPVLSV